MTPLKIDLATLQDVEKLVRLEDICFLTDRLSASQFKRFIRSPTACVLAAKNDEAIAGAILLFRKNSKIARLYSLAVDPSYQKQGIAQAIHHRLEEECVKRRCTELRLEVRPDNHAAIRFYEKNQFEVFGEYKNFYEDQTHALRMRKSLTRREIAIS